MAKMISTTPTPQISAPDLGKPPVEPVNGKSKSTPFFHYTYGSVCLLCLRTKTCTSVKTEPEKHRQSRLACVRYVVLLSRYLNLDTELTRLAKECYFNPSFLKEDGNGDEGQGSENEGDAKGKGETEKYVICDMCFPLAESFCKAYQDCELLKMKLEAKMLESAACVSKTDVLGESLRVIKGMKTKAGSKADANTEIDPLISFRNKLKLHAPQAMKLNGPRVQLKRDNKADELVQVQKKIPKLPSSSSTASVSPVGSDKSANEVESVKGEEDVIKKDEEGEIPSPMDITPISKPTSTVQIVRKLPGTRSKASYVNIIRLPKEEKPAEKDVKQDVETLPLEKDVKSESSLVQEDIKTELPAAKDAGNEEAIKKDVKKQIPPENDNNNNNDNDDSDSDVEVIDIVQNTKFVSRRKGYFVPISVRGRGRGRIGVSVSRAGPATVRGNLSNKVQNEKMVYVRKGTNEPISNRTSVAASPPPIIASVQRITPTTIVLKKKVVNKCPTRAEPIKSPQNKDEINTVVTPTATSSTQRASPKKNTVAQSKKTVNKRTVKTVSVEVNAAPTAPSAPSTQQPINSQIACPAPESIGSTTTSVSSAVRTANPKSYKAKPKRYQSAKPATSVSAPHMPCPVGVSSHIQMCNINGCGLTFSKTERGLLDLLTHLDTHEGFQCSLCIEACKTPFELMTHELKHEETNPIRKTKQGFQCPRCPHYSMFRTEFQEHFFERHLNTKIELLKCHLCKRGFSHLKEKQYRTHIANSHPNETKDELAHCFSCMICRVLFKRKTNLWKHLKNDHRINCQDGPHKCPKCSDSFAFNNLLELHKEFACESIQRLPCLYPGCTSSFIREDLLKKHLQKTHDSTYPLPECQVCKLQFYDMPSLTNHVITHNGEQIKFVFPDGTEMYQDPQIIPVVTTAPNLENHNVLPVYENVQTVQTFIPEINWTSNILVPSSMPTPPPAPTPPPVLVSVPVPGPPHVPMTVTTSSTSYQPVPVPVVNTPVSVNQQPSQAPSTEFDMKAFEELFDESNDSEEPLMEFFENAIAAAGGAEEIPPTDEDPFAWMLAEDFDIS